MTSSSPEERVSSEGIQIEDTRDREWVQGLSNGSGVETAIVLEVMAALLAHPPTELTMIEVNSRRGIVTLKGQVESVHLQTMAGDIASRHPGVEATVNALEICKRAKRVSDT